MAPTISSGDKILMENFTYLRRKPQRGDLVVFKTKGIAAIPAGSIFVKRLAGLPGDHLQISGGKLFVNGRHLPLRNNVGEITYLEPRLYPRAQITSTRIDLKIPDGQYYVLGDNQSNSFDSRYWGCVPERNIIGRATMCYWPTKRAGRLK